MSGLFVSLTGMLGLIGMLPEEACGVGASAGAPLFILPGASAGSGAVLILSLIHI